MTTGPIVIGSRGSALALWQAHEVARRLGGETSIRVIETAGDRFLGVALQGQLEKGFFTKEIEDRLLAGDIDLAVHSLKDLPTGTAAGLTVGAFLPRAPVSDLLLVRPEALAVDRPLRLRPGARVGARSLRRQALLRLFAPDAEPTFLRGNVPTRIRKCRDGEYDAILLARAGVERLAADLGPLVRHELDPDQWLPAPGQGAIAVEARSGDERVLPLLTAIDDQPTRAAVEIERGLLARFEGGCHTAFGAYATEAGGEWTVRVGLERPGDGWVATTLGASFDRCLALGPQDLATLFRVPQAPEGGPWLRA